jgi:hypothetical protein
VRGNLNVLDRGVNHGRSPLLVRYHGPFKNM